MKQSSIFIAAISLGIASASSAAIVIANSAAASFPGSNGTTTANMIDGILSASTATYPTVVALTEANKTSLVSNAGYAFVGSAGGQFIGNNTNGQTVTFTFTDQTIGEVLLWNYSQNAARGLDAITMVEIMTDGATWVDQGLSLTLLDAGTAGFKSQSLSLGGDITGVDGIRLTLAQGDTGGGETAGGFDEVAFSNAIPEPSSAIVGGLGLLALLRRRRA